MNPSVEDFVQVNRDYYNNLYSGVAVSECVRQVSDLDNFVRMKRNNTAFLGLYFDRFEARLPGRRVIEFGFGDGVNALFMAQLGAAVWAVEISEEACRNLAEAARRLGVEVHVLCGDFRELDLPEADLVVGQGILHHLDHSLENELLSRVASLLRPGAGTARFVEPAVNSRTLNSLRWAVPLRDRPSCLQRKAFQQWQSADPHPPRHNSTRHFVEAGRQHFSQVEVTPIGGLERFRRLISHHGRNHAFAEWALGFERRHLPRWLHLPLARSQVITYSGPR
jgi:SAM-dependent methyltransferase